MPEPSLADDLALALAIAGDADLIAIDRYRAQDLDVQLKPDRTQVTDADRRVEQLVRDRIRASRRGDAVLGEEFGEDFGEDFGEEFGAAGEGSRVWIVDPIDGTSNFVRGVPNWGLLLALVVDGVPKLGVVSAPALGRRWWAVTGRGAWGQERGGAARRLSVSGVSELGEASLSYNSLKSWDEAGRLDALIALSRSVNRTRAYGDLWAYMLVAEGAVDVAGEFDLKPWDVAAIIPIIREAGGAATTADGDDSLEAGSLLVSNGLLHGAVLDLLSGA